MNQKECEFCDRPAKYFVKVTDMSGFYEHSQLHSEDKIAFRCAYHKLSTRRYYETEYNSHRPISEYVEVEN